MEEFPGESLNSYYKGKEFIRISPITKTGIRGIVKEIVFRKSLNVDEKGEEYISPQIIVISTENINYNFSEVYFKNDLDG